MQPSAADWMPPSATLIATPGLWLERGVAVPFTTPSLFGARLRQRDGGALELLLPNPAGREGWFVLPWSAAVEAHRPTLADLALLKALQPGAAPLTPARLRRVALRVAEDGLGGRGLRRAAAAARAATARRELALRGRLERHGPRAAGHAPQFHGPGLEPVEGECVARQRGLAQLAMLFREWAPGAPTAADQVRMQRLAYRADCLAEPLAGLIAAAREALMARLGEPFMRSTSLPELARPDWLLEGWDVLAALLRVASAEERLLVLRRAASLVPPLPEEVLAWPGCAGLPVTDALPLGAPGLAPGGVARLEAGFAAWLEPAA